MVIKVYNVHDMCMIFTFYFLSFCHNADEDFCKRVKDFACLIIIMITAFIGISVCCDQIY